MGLRGITAIVENQMEKNLEKETETVLIGVYVGCVL